MRELTEKEQALIEGVELTLDYGLPVSNEDFKKYIELTKDRGKTNA